MNKTASDSIVKLRELIPKLPVPSFQDITLESAPNFVEMDMDHGVGFGFNLYYEEDVVSCARWFSNEGAFFPVHSHPQLEVIIVYYGDMTIQLYNSEGERTKEECLFPGRAFYIEGDIPHSAYFSSDTWYLAITVPANEAWPHG